MVSQFAKGFRRMDKQVRKFPRAVYNLSQTEVEGRNELRLVPLSPPRAPAPTDVCRSFHSLPNSSCPV